MAHRFPARREPLANPMKEFNGQVDIGPQVNEFEGIVEATKTTSLRKGRHNCLHCSVRRTDTEGQVNVSPAARSEATQ